MRIGELAQAAHTPVETVRYYEREGLLRAPARTASNYRSYTPEHLDTLLFIRRCRGLDMALDEIRQLLSFREHPGQDCGGVNGLLDAHIGHVAQRIAELRSLQTQLRALRARCQVAHSTADCGILQGLANPTPATVPTALAKSATDAPVSSRRHIPGAHGKPGVAA